MVPNKGAISNSETALSTAWKQSAPLSKKDLEERLTPELAEQLFAVLKNWGTIIEADVPSLKLNNEEPLP